VADLLTAEGLARFDEVAAGYVGDDKVPGCVALVARGEEVHVRALGSLAIGGSPVRRDSLFRIASTTKPITGAATAALAGEGLFSLDEPVDRLLPELANPRVLRRIDGPLDDTVPAERAVTLRDLLTFTFGFGMLMDMFMSPEPWPVVAATNEMNLHTIGEPSPSGQPDPDTWIAGLAAGEPLDEVLRTRIFEPLGMRDTAFWTSDTSRLATAYGTAPDGLRVWDEPDGQWSQPPAFGDAGAVEHVARGDRSDGKSGWQDRHRHDEPVRLASLAGRGRDRSALQRFADDRRSVHQIVQHPHLCISG
jgi:CubicO group peptidase (beta-lactamase class C family)